MSWKKLQLNAVRPSACAAAVALPPSSAVVEDYRPDLLTEQPEFTVGHNKDHDQPHCLHVAS